MRFAIAGLALALLVTALACGSGGATAGDATAEEATAVQVTSDILERGNEIYQMNCAPCHGEGGKGDGRAAANLNPAPRDHTDPELMEKLTDRSVAETVKMGGGIRGYPNMPSHPHLRGDDLVALVAFVRSLHREGVAAVDLEGFQ